MKCPECDTNLKVKKCNEFCEGHVSCPNTRKEECGKIVVSKVLFLKDGTTIGRAATVLCFGCGKTHNVEEE